MAMTVGAPHESWETAMSPLYRIESIRSAERAARAGLSPGTLMARAGQVAADRIAARLSSGSRVGIVCGPGDNGGDAWVVARRLRERGHAVMPWPVFPPSVASDDARAAHAAYAAGAGTALAGQPVGTLDAVVDGLFGIGLTRPLSGAALEATRWMQRQEAPIFALDVPSGLDADTGQWVGGVVGVQADVTITFLGDKPGLHTAEGIDAVGEVIVEPLGTTPPATLLALTQPSDFPALWTRRANNTHKGRFGSLCVTGGAPGMTGAALLAARAGLRLGAGRVYVELLDASLQGGLDPLQPELMLRPAPHGETLGAQVLGCGAGDHARVLGLLDCALAAPHALVLDADALNALAAGPGSLDRLQGRRAPTVLTPHPLEAARLAGVMVQAIQQDRVAAALLLARRSGAVVVLKGAGTVVAVGERAWINPTGGPALATAGTGDVLAGIIGALLAQGFDVQQAALGGVWLHGRAAQRHGADIGLVAGEVAALAVRELAELRAGSQR
jgi:hydroxyethylthiazole kinase-like uncharacterized protein yjeF